MEASAFKEAIRARLAEAVAGCPFVLSATLTGSFLESASLEGISDIDFVVVCDELDGERFATLKGRCEALLAPTLKEGGYDLRINASLGPLKFNEANLAVLHLMPYSHAGHVDHVINSPFTCLDWQRSAEFHRLSLAQVYPVFQLQPRHFLGARRGLGDYLKDLRAGTISYRDLSFEGGRYAEVPSKKPMTARDRHEFGFHVLRFLMSNLLKLLTRENRRLGTDELLGQFFRHFPEGADRFGPLYRELERGKKAHRFTESDLLPALEEFVAAFERQFRAVFFAPGVRHTAFRHAATGWNARKERIFQGRSDQPILPPAPADCAALVAQLTDLPPARVYSSPLSRTGQSLEAVARLLPGGLPATEADPRLSEIDYGDLEGLTVGEARGRYPALFAAWAAGEDPAFPGGGEDTGAVLARALDFARARWAGAGGATASCTHNVVLRCLVGHALGVPRGEWHRLDVPHLAPITFLQTREYGLFVDLLPAVERQLFADWARLPATR